MPCKQVFIRHKIIIHIITKRTSKFKIGFQEIEGAKLISLQDTQTDSYNSISPPRRVYLILAQDRMRSSKFFLNCRWLSKINSRQAARSVLLIAYPDDLSRAFALFQPARDRSMGQGALEMGFETERELRAPRACESSRDSSSSSSSLCSLPRANRPNNHA